MICVTFDGMLLHCIETCLGQMQMVSEDANMVTDSPTLWLYFFPSGIFMAACWPVCMRIKSMKRARVGRDTLIIVVFGVLAKGRGITERVTQRSRA